MRNSLHPTICVYILVVFALFLPAKTAGQTQRIAALRKSIANTTDRKKLCDLYNRLADNLYSYSFEDGVVNARTGLELASEVDYKHGKAEALNLIGTYHYFKGQNNDAIVYYRRSLREAPLGEFKDFPARTYIRLSIYFRQTGRFDSAQWYLDQTKKIVDAKESPSLMASVLASQGILDNALSRNEAAIKNMMASIRIRTDLKDSTRLADSWRNLGSVYTDLSLYDSADLCYQKAEEIISRLHNPEMRMLLGLSRGETYYLRGDFAKAIDEYTTSFNIVKTNIYRRYYAHLLYKIGELYESEGVYHTAFDFLFNALKELEKLGARPDMAKVYLQIGWCYNYQENYTLAMENANKGLQLSLQIADSASLAQSKNLIGNILFKQKKYEEALVHLNDALNIRKRIKNWWGASFSLYNLALAEGALGETQKSFDLLHEALSIDERIGKKTGIIFTCNELGNKYAQQRNFAKASMYLNRARELAAALPVAPQLLTNYKNQISLYQFQGNSKKVIEYYELYTKLKDSLSNEVNADRISKSDALFQLQKKANEIELINKENELHEERIKVQEAEIKFQKKVIIGGSIGLLVLTILIATIFRLYKLNRRAKETLHIQNQEILEQKEEIQAQSEELAESNQQLNLLNNDLETRVRKRTVELNESYAELETFLYRTSHDFRRPLTTYLGLVEVANSMVSDAQALDLFQKVKETTLGLDVMLLKLQSISNSEDTSVQAIDLRSLIDECIAKFNIQILERQLKVTILVPSNSITSNAFLLRTGIENLIENSVNFARSHGGMISIGATIRKNILHISVEDNGEGIAEEYQPRIFEMYFRASHNSKGNGLGLYIAKKAIGKLDGKISFVSTKGDGSKFVIEVPVNRK